MRDRAFVWNGALAGVAVAAAGFAAYGPKAQRGEDKVVVVAGQAAELTALEWREEGFVVRVTPGAKGAPAQVSVQKSAGDTTEAAPQVFPGTERATSLLSESMPLQAQRSLGPVEPAQLAGLGLEEPSATLVLQLASGPKEVKIGNATYGSGDRYGTVDGKEVFLLAANTVAPLRSGAPTLIERRALPVEAMAVKSAKIAFGAQSREVIQRNREEKNKAFYADPGEPNQRLDQVTSWMDRVLKLRLGDVATETPTGSPQMEVEIFGADGSLGKVQIWPVKDAHALVRSSLFPQSMTLAKANAEAVLREVESVLQEGR